MKRKKKNRRLMPASKGTAPLDVVIAVMAFLAALALGASLIAQRAADGWSEGLSSKITVQIMPPTSGPARDGLDRETEAALAVLKATPGIAHAAPLSQDEQLKLVQPWLGAEALVADLPLPQLIDADVAPGSQVNIEDLTARLKAAVPSAVLDDHSHWIGRLRGLARTLVWSAYGILFLIAVATASTVAFATRAGLDAHNDMVSLLHQMGAQAGFIARAFEGHYFRATLLAAGAGAAFAAVFFQAAGGLELVGYEPVPFLPSLTLKPIELLWLLAVPAAAGLIALITARLSVLAALRAIH
jgi:cell division transport system permease protein